MSIKPVHTQSGGNYIQKQKRKNLNNILTYNRMTVHILKQTPCDIEPLCSLMVLSYHCNRLVCHHTKSNIPLLNQVLTRRQGCVFPFCVLEAFTNHTTIYINIPHSLSTFNLFQCSTMKLFDWILKIVPLLHHSPPAINLHLSSMLNDISICFPWFSCVHTWSIQIICNTKRTPYITQLREFVPPQVFLTWCNTCTYCTSVDL